MTSLLCFLCSLLLCFLCSVSLPRKQGVICDAEIGNTYGQYPFGITWELLVFLTFSPPILIIILSHITPVFFFSFLSISVSDFSLRIHYIFSVVSPLTRHRNNPETSREDIAIPFISQNAHRYPKLHSCANFTTQ